MNAETVFHHHSKRNQFLILSTFFCSLFFSNVFFPSKQIKIMFKVFQLILNINIKGKVFISYRIVLWNGTKTYTIWSEHGLKCHFKIVAKQGYWNRTCTWVFSRKFAAYFQNTCPKSTSGGLLMEVEKRNLTKNSASLLNISLRDSIQFLLE